MRWHWIVGIGIMIGSVAVALPVVHAATTSSLNQQISAHEQEIAQLNQEIAKYQAELKKADANKKTLQDAIGALNLKRTTVETQIRATQSKINATQLQIQQLGDSIAKTQSSINADQAALAEDLRSIQEMDEKPLIMQIFSSASLSSAWQDADATLQVQRAIQTNVDALSTHKVALSAAQASTQQQKNALVSQKDTLSSQKTSLTQTKDQKTRLLKETSAKESTYQRLLAQAKKELASFSTFAANAGGSGLLTNQTKCDSWGCYYNQRDAQWGNDPLNGTKYRLKSDGCLVTSVAMVMTHYGYKNVTPVTINSNPANFAAYYPAYLLMTIHVDGMTVTRKSAYINATLNAGKPVIVGVYAYGGTHFVVLTKRANGGYIMRDPYVPNGDGIPFSSHYSLRNVFSVGKVTIS